MLLPMSWYQAIVSPDGAIGKIGREIPLVFFDPRSLRSLHDELKASGAIEVERASTERRVEARGKMLLRDPHVMVIQSRPDLNFKYPEGPPPFVMRDLSRRGNPPLGPKP